MLGRRNPQRSFFEAQCWPHQVPPDSFYARMGAVNDELFHDDDLAHMYCPDNGRPSWPPSFMSGVTLLQFHDDVSDDEAVERLMFDIRWKVALNLPLDFVPPHPTTIAVFRKRLAEHGEERYAFNRFIRVGRAAGFLPDKVTMLIDSTPQNGAGAVQDTYTLIRKGIRKILRLAGYTLPKKRQGLSANLGAYLDSDRKAQIDWADPAARAAQLKTLVRDAEAVLELVAEQADDPEVRSAAWVLTKILGDDVTIDEHGDPQIAKGVAEDRIVSLTDPEMRHGHKSAAKRFDGHKMQVAADQQSELLLAVEPVAANSGDGRDLMTMIETVEEQHGVTVERVIGDGAYGTGDNRAACMQRHIDLVSPLAVPSEPEVDKTAFDIDLDAKRVTCPQGHVATDAKTVKDAQGRAVLLFTFARETCEACPLFERCVHSRTRGRSICTHYHEKLLQAARSRQQTDEFKETYVLRAAIERQIAGLVRHGLREARYVGKTKNRLQAQWTGAAINRRRLFALFRGDMAQMRQILATVP
jgi:transposase